MKPSLKPLALTAAVSVLMSQLALAQISIDFRTVGNVGNPNDSTGYGGVNYSYLIGTYEVTVSQYAAFLNAVAKADPYNLYNPSMGSDLNIGRISRTGTAGSYVYTAVGGGGNLPITYVSWFDAARFVNWLVNGQPVGPQAVNTTETGTYTLLGATSGVGFARNATLSFAIANENEWYKAAYHQPASQGGDSDDYWLYPTANNTIPNSRNGSLSDPNSANFFRDDGIANGYNGGYAVNNSLTPPTGTALTSGGAFSVADSFYGTYDQGGNVWEWSEAILGSARIIRGGSWSGNDSGLQSINRSSFAPPNENAIIGFRIVVVPEPGVVGLMALGVVLLVCRRKRAL